MIGDVEEGKESLAKRDWRGREACLPLMMSRRSSPPKRRRRGRKGVARSCSGAARARRSLAVEEEEGRRKNREGKRRGSWRWVGGSGWNDARRIGSESGRRGGRELRGCCCHRLSWLRTWMSGKGREEGVDAGQDEGEKSVGCVRDVEFDRCKRMAPRMTRDDGDVGKLRKSTGFVGRRNKARDSYARTRGRTSEEEVGKV
jgi:hypothetical protein